MPIMVIADLSDFAVICQIFCTDLLDFALIRLASFNMKRKVQSSTFSTGNPLIQMQ